jgi:quinohemoprotein amine dehydrogenase
MRCAVRRRPVRRARSAVLLAAVCSVLAGDAAAQQQAATPGPRTGHVVTSDVVVRSCGSCHRRDEQGRLSRISYLRKTPEGWQTSIRRMVSLHGAKLEPDAAREVVRYLSNQQGLAPEELAPARFEVERRTIDYAYSDSATERVCNACHSMGRIITERRTKEEWQLLIATHRALYPLSDFQRFRTNTPPHPMDRAINHLADAFPLETPAWKAWSANVRPPRLEGAWILSGHHPAHGALHGRVTIRPAAGKDDEFETQAEYVFPGDGTTVRRTGRAIVYTGHQWRGRSTASNNADERREVMSIERGWAEMQGRWYNGAYDEDGIDVTLRRATAAPVITAVHPRGLKAGARAVEVRIYGANLPATLSASTIDFGPGVRVSSVTRASAENVVVRVNVADSAAAGARDLFLAGATRTNAVAVYDRIHSVRVLPRAGMARIGGAVMPKQLQQFEAIAYHNGPDGRANTADDLDLGRVPVQWSLEEYPVTHDDDDIKFVGAIDANGLFTPALDGPNPQRSGNRNNVGDVWVIASFSPPGAPASAQPLRGRAHLLVTVPNFMRFDPWPSGDVTGRVTNGRDGGR